MPRRETRDSIVRALAAGHPRSLRKLLLEVPFEEFERRRDDIERSVRRNSRRRPPGMAPALVEPPRGPQPLQGGAAAPLEFD